MDEPDAMAIVHRGESIASVVTHERKQQLLIQARAERRKWVQKVPLPYASARDPNNVWSSEDRLYPVHSSVACKRLPTATKVLSELYGLETHTRTPEEVAQRVELLVGQWVSYLSSLPWKAILVLYFPFPFSILLVSSPFVGSPLCE